jgi:hypothetical protein
MQRAPAARPLDTPPSSWRMGCAGVTGWDVIRPLAYPPSPRSFGGTRSIADRSARSGTVWPFTEFDVAFRAGSTCLEIGCAAAVGARISRVHWRCV